MSPPASFGLLPLIFALLIGLSRLHLGNPLTGQLSIGQNVAGGLRDHRVVEEQHVLIELVRLLGDQVSALGGFLLGCECRDRADLDQLVMSGLARSLPH